MEPLALASAWPSRQIPKQPSAQALPSCTLMAMEPADAPVDATVSGQLGYNANPSFNSVLGNGAPAFFWSNAGTLPAAYASSVTQGGLPAYQKPPFFDPTLNTGYCTGPGCLAAGGAITYGDPNIGGVLRPSTTTP